MRMWISYLSFPRYNPALLYIGHVHIIHAQFFKNQNINIISFRFQLQPSVTEDMLGEVFSVAGKVEEVQLSRDEGGQCRGYGIIGGCKSVSDHPNTTTCRIVNPWNPFCRIILSHHLILSMGALSKNSSDPSKLTHLNKYSDEDSKLSSSKYHRWNLSI